MKLLDSSFILSLSKIRALHLLRLGDQPYYTIPEVFEEIVTKGITVGYPDAIIIKEEPCLSGCCPLNRLTYCYC